MNTSIRQAIGHALRVAAGSLVDWSHKEKISDWRHDKTRLLTAQSKRERKNALRLQHRVQ